MRLLRLAFLLCLMAAMCFAAELKVTNVQAVPRWPWNGKVDISYCIEYADFDENTMSITVKLHGYDKDKDVAMDVKTVSGDGILSSVKPGGPYHLVWDASTDYPTLNSSSFHLGVQAVLSRTGGQAPNVNYMVVDLTTGKTRYTNEAPDLTSDTCRTTELWMRWIPAGTFTMGSPEDELGRDDRDGREVQHDVTLSKGYWMGIFEVTQKQWSLLTGSNPSYYQGDTRPVECVSYNDIRGTEEGAGWPSGGHEVDAESFLGKLRSKTGLAFDLPTEAQWEYACRAGTTTALNSGKNLTETLVCPNMAEVGRYWYNRSDGRGGYNEHTKVGSYLPNAWGLYDMHGNVYEWCLDWYGNYPMSAVTDPQGSPAGSVRVLRGGRWYSGARGCRSAHRDYYYPSYCSNRIGFRGVVCP